METKKISFGFMKTKKQEKPTPVEHKEYIECVEEKSIKVVGGNEIKDEAPLVIPLKPNTLITAERLKEIAEKIENFEEPVPIEDGNKLDVIPENETLEQMAARELLGESKKKAVIDAPTLVVPVPAQPVLDGQKESTLDDYESVPIQDFGMAMLRGMGWAPGKDQSKYKQPQLRPKGLGLGADKVIKENQKKKSTTKEEEDLSIVKNSYVKITTGKYAGFYGQVVSLDEENGRAMIDIPIKKETVSLSEFMLQPVTKSEYDKESKVINAGSYEEYKKNENTKHTKEHSKSDKDSSSRQRNFNDKKNKEYEDRLSNSKNIALDQINNSQRDKEQRSRNKSSKKYSSNESLNSTDSEYHKSKDRRRRNSTSSDSSSSYRHKKKSHSKSSKEKRDIDKKRKGKKKRRDRDRSPNYKKYRK